jgi:hypothetical protein
MSGWQGKTLCLPPLIGTAGQQHAIFGVGKTMWRPVAAVVIMGPSSIIYQQCIQPSTTSSSAKFPQHKFLHSSTISAAVFSSQV